MTASPRRRLSLRRNFLWILLGSMVENGAKWLMFIILTKVAAPALVGSFALALAIATPITILAQLQLRVVLITDAADDYPFGVYYAMRLASTGLGVAVIAAVSLALYGAGFMSALTVIIGLGQAVQSLRDIWVGLAQKHERMDVTARGNMIDGLLSLVFFSVALATTRNLLIAVTGMLVARVLTWLLYDRRRVRGVLDPGFSTRPRWHGLSIRRLSWVALPLGLTTALVSLNSNIPRYVIEYFMDKEHVGYYASIAYFVMATRLIIGSLSRAASPRLAILFRTDKRRYARLLGRLLGIGAVLGAGNVVLAWLVGEPFLRVVYSAEYARYSHILVILLCASALGYMNSFLGVGISAARLFAIQPFMYVAIGVTTLLGCWLMIPSLGLDGAAWAAVITNGVATSINIGVVVYAYRRGPLPPVPAASSAQ